MLRDIENDVKQFMKDFDEQKHQAATVVDDAASLTSSKASDARIHDQINSAFTAGASKTKAELLLWQK